MRSLLTLKHTFLKLPLATIAASLLATLPTAHAGEFLARAGLSSAAPPGHTSTPLGQTLSQLAPSADSQVLALAANALACAEPDAERLAVIDYSRPSTEPRLWVFDLDEERLMFEELVSHGRGSGDAEATVFSNTPESYQSSLGLFRTMNSYYGRNGYSLRLEGLEAGINDLAYQRAIVIHGADYVSEDFIRQTGRLGRSHGCPAVTREVTYPLIDSIKEDHYLFVYYPDSQWLETSAFINCERTDRELALN